MSATFIPPHASSLAAHEPLKPAPMTIASELLVIEEINCCPADDHMLSTVKSLARLHVPSSDWRVQLSIRQSRAPFQSPCIEHQFGLKEHLADFCDGASGKMRTNK